MEALPQSLKTAVRMNPALASAHGDSAHGDAVGHAGRDALQRRSLGLRAGAAPSPSGSALREGWPEVAEFDDQCYESVPRGGTLAYRGQDLTRPCRTNHLRPASPVRPFNPSGLRSTSLGSEPRGAPRYQPTNCTLHLSALFCLTRTLQSPGPSGDDSIQPPHEDPGSFGPYSPNRTLISNSDH
jgi:hypothetical protein